MRYEYRLSNPKRNFNLRGGDALDQAILRRAVGVNADPTNFCVSNLYTTLYTRRISIPFCYIAIVVISTFERRSVERLFYAVVQPALYQRLVIVTSWRILHTIVHNHTLCIPLIGACLPKVQGSHAQPAVCWIYALCRRTLSPCYRVP